MILMLNGAFGVGKTTVATALQRHLSGSLIFDPEPIGILARHLTEEVRRGSEDTDDFQDIALWRSLTLAAAQDMYFQYHHTLIVPMTLVQPNYFATIKQGFEQIAPVYHFCLTAPFSVIEQRLLERGDDSNSWAWRKTQSYVPLLSAPRYARHIETAHRDVSAIVSEIIAHIQ